MEVIDHPSKILRRTVTGRRSIISGHLIAPGAVKRIFRNSHQFDMRIAHLFDIGTERFCKFAVCIKPRIFLIARMAHPGARMHFINTHRLLIHRSCRRTFFHPRIVRPFEMIDIYDTGRRARTFFRKVCVRIRLVELSSVRRLDHIFVETACPKMRHK